MPPRNDEKNSMLYWYPKIKDLDIPMPRTEILELNGLSFWGYPDGSLSANMPKIREAAGKIGYPQFVRTDLASAKWEWKETCFVEHEGDLEQHIRQILEFNYTADVLGLPCKALAFREYIPMKNLFTAFHGDMPVNPEIRFFVQDGEIQCHHWYWIPDAIKNPSVANWKEIMQREKEAISGNDLLWLEKDAAKVSHKLDGFWSVDFCKAKDERWILIDCATAEDSWHPEDCPCAQPEGIKDRAHARGN